MTMIQISILICKYLYVQYVFQFSLIEQICSISISVYKCFEMHQYNYKIYLCLKISYLESIQFSENFQEYKSCDLMYKS